MENKPYAIAVRIYDERIKDIKPFEEIK